MMNPYSKMGVFGPNRRKTKTHATRGKGKGKIAQKYANNNWGAKQHQQDEQKHYKNTKAKKA